MAGDWLKVLKTTIDKPEIAIIAEAMNCSQEAAFGWWFRLYSYLDDTTADGFLIGMSLKRLALLARVPEAVCLALASGGWLFENIEKTARKKPGVMVSNWDRHNGKSAKKRCLDSRRSNEYYARKQSRKTPPKLYGA